MTEKERLEKFLREAEDFLGKNLTRDDSKFKAWNNALIRFCEKKYGNKSNTTTMFKERLYTFGICAINTPTSRFIEKFEEDLKTTIEDLKMLIDECEDPLYRTSFIKQEEASKSSMIPVNVNITNNNNNSNSNSNIINVLTIDELRKQIEENTFLDDDSKEELYEKLNEIEELKQSKESKSKKWIKAKAILSFILDKGADIAIMFIPQILAALSK